MLFTRTPFLPDTFSKTAILHSRFAGRPSKFFDFHFLPLSSFALLSIFLWASSSFLPSPGFVQRIDAPRTSNPVFMSDKIPDAGDFIKRPSCVRPLRTACLCVSFSRCVGRRLYRVVGRVAHASRGTRRMPKPYQQGLRRSLRFWSATTSVTPTGGAGSRRDARGPCVATVTDKSLGELPALRRYSERIFVLNVGRARAWEGARTCWLAWLNSNYQHAPAYLLPAHLPFYFLE